MIYSCGAISVKILPKESIFVHQTAHNKIEIITNGSENFLNSPYVGTVPHLPHHSTCISHFIKHLLNICATQTREYNKGCMYTWNGCAIVVTVCALWLTLQTELRRNIDKLYKEEEAKDATVLVLPEHATDWDYSDGFHTTAPALLNLTNSEQINQHVLNIKDSTMCKVPLVTCGVSGI